MISVCQISEVPMNANPKHAPAMSAPPSPCADRTHQVRMATATIAHGAQPNGAKEAEALSPPTAAKTARAHHGRGPRQRRTDTGESAAVTAESVAAGLDGSRVAV